MLSYQHAYHAGNLADVHKHALLAWMLDYLTQKPKPLTYIETHSGRALYDLTGDAAQKTGEAAQGIEKAADWFAQDHPYARVLRGIREDHGAAAYPGSPLIAARLLRSSDALHLAELHPQEQAALALAMSPFPAKVYQQDGFDLAHALTPPTPRRGMLLIDPSYEVKDDYATIPRHIEKIARAWNVGVIVLWYPVLKNRAHGEMINRLMQRFPDALRHEVRFPPARPGHGMVGSGIFVLNPPFGLQEEAAALGLKFGQL